MVVFLELTMELTASAGQAGGFYQPLELEELAPFQANPQQAGFIFR